MPVRQHRTDPDDPLPDILIEVDGEPVSLASPEDLIVYKRIADRPRDRDDVSAIVRTQARAGRDLDWGHVERWATFWRIEDRLQRLLRDRDE